MPNEIENSNSVEISSWIESQPLRKRCRLASRAALRVFANTIVYNEQAGPDFILPALRACLLSSVIGHGKSMYAGSPASILVTSAKLESDDYFGNAFNSSIDSAFFSANAAILGNQIGLSEEATLLSINFARNAFSNAQSVDGKAGGLIGGKLAFEEAVSRDIDLIDKLHTVSLWEDEQAPELIVRNHLICVKFLEANPVLRFWSSFYKDIWEGNFTKWDVATEVIQIDETFWRKGAEAVAAEIEKIEAKFLIQKLPQIEDVFETQTGLYDISSSTIELSDLINSISHRVEFACKLALESNTCDFDDFSTAAKLLRYALENCADDPNAYEQFLRQARSLISDGLARGDFSHHDTLDVLIGTLDEAGLQLRADHPEIASAVKSRSEQAVREMSEAKRLEGVGLIEDLRKEGTTGRLDTEMSLAAETVRDGTSDEATASALKRSGNQAGKISLAEKAKNAEGSGQMAAVKIAMRAQNVVEYVLSIIGGGGAG